MVGRSNCFYPHALLPVEDRSSLARFPAFFWDIGDRQTLALFAQHGLVDRIPCHANLPTCGLLLGGVRWVRHFVRCFLAAVVSTSSLLPHPSTLHPNTHSAACLACLAHCSSLHGSFSNTGGEPPPTPNTTTFLPTTVMPATLRAPFHQTLGRHYV